MFAVYVHSETDCGIRNNPLWIEKEDGDLQQVIYNTEQEAKDFCGSLLGTVFSIIDHGD